MKRLLCILMSTIMILLVPAEVLAQSDLVSPAEENQYIVMVNDEEKLKNLEDTYDASAVDGAENICVVDLTEYQAERLDNKDYVVSIEKDIMLTGSEASSEKSQEMDQWYLDAAGVTGDEEVNDKINIELLDSGVDYSNEFMPVENINLNDEDLNESPVFVDNTGHGTAIASVICADKNNSSIEGINDSANLYSVKVLDSNNQSPLSRIVEGIYWGIENNIDIINMSFGTEVDSEIMYTAVKAAYDAGILMVAAAGNTKHQAVQYPAAYDEVISVGSVNSNGELSEYTSTGTNLDVLAPGECIAAIDLLDSITGVSGTSIATAQVTGIASLLWSRDKTKSNDFIKQLICSAVNKPSSLTGTEAGIVNCKNAFEVYNEFEAAYIPTQITERIFEVNDDFDYSDFVEALWRNPSSVPGHYELATSASEYAGFSGNAPKLARYACTKLDEVNNDLVKIKKQSYCPHGSANYMISLKFLFSISRCVYDNGTGTEYENMIKSYENNKSYWNVSWHPENENFDKARFDELVAQVKYLLKNRNLMETSINNKFDTYSKETQNRYLGMMIFGMALHLAGDMYAHRTIVPKYTVEGTNPKTKTKNSDGQTMLGYGDFDRTDTYSDDDSHKKLIKDACYSDKIIGSIKYWEYIQKGVYMQVVEFRDINMFLKDGKQGSDNPYEDDASFCNERYKASLQACKRIAKRFKEAGSFYTKLVYPKVYGGTAAQNKPYKTVKLNNFQNYTTAAGLALEGVDLTMEDWKINSNTSLV
ncbi:MAG: S8 family serine peptidase [Acetobacter sp.]|nr:S8 family serine peptidase [Bacteroides sp.]MCM1341914.1 S8 family serine peptidase [Acetobacter sp.]MCM1434098.1 S8 family serine peptidase [Clostridiales bacterium]